MSKLLGVVGYSGSGKSTSLRNMPHEETVIISPSKLDLPIPGFKNKYKPFKDEGKTGNFYSTDKLSALSKISKLVSEQRKEIKYLVVEDFTHFFNAYTMSEAFRAQNSGNAAWSRWSDFGASVYNSIFKDKDLRDDLTVIIMFHPESYMTPTGEKLKIKSPGNLLEREVDLPSYFTNLLFTKVIPVSKDGDLPSSERYRFVTNDDGYATAKTPYGMFEENELYIPNDLYEVIKRIEKFENE